MAHLAKILSGTVVGLEGVLVEVEADLGAGLPSFTIVGLPDKAVEEAKERVRAAISNSGGNFPSSRLTINLAPADIKKEGPAFDLPIAIGVLAATGEAKISPLEKSLVFGELALDGALRHISGAIALGTLARGKKIKKIFCPKVNAPEVALVEGLEIYPLDSLVELLDFLAGQKKLKKFTLKKSAIFSQEKEEYEYDFAYIKGQEHAKRALEIAASGGHNLLMTGPPGGGKTLLARSLPSILPPLELDEALEVTRIYSVAGLLPKDKPILKTRPVRSPHHTTSNVALVGGGQWPKPGEISLAHRGVLFLDEFPEFPRSVLEALRQPLEDRIITVSRAQGSLTFPADFILVAAMNPCRCGYLNSDIKPCICSPAQILNYSKRISGPLLDRIDLHLDIPQIKYEKLARKELAEPSKRARERVIEARKIQRKRFKSRAVKLRTNAEMGPKEIGEYCPLDKTSEELLKTAMMELNLSARSYHRILKLSLTIADLEGAPDIKPDHIAEALQYRPKERVNI